ncbi:unnamed protein product [Linum trigynum]|uniref:SMP domain-containing protein n=1 Tax=Linum trigynum TaxID=586398 RepID=A0AAV2FZM4_9ROSI
MLENLTQAVASLPAKGTGAENTARPTSVSGESGALAPGENGRSGLGSFSAKTAASQRGEAAEVKGVKAAEVEGVKAADVESGNTDRAGHDACGRGSGSGLLPTPSAQEIATIRGKAKMLGYDDLGPQ